MPALGQGLRPLAFLLRKWRQRQRPEAAIDRAYPAWAAAAYAPADARNGPKISIVMPVRNPPPAFLKAAIASVQAQSYQNWELCIVDDASSAADIPDIQNDAAQRDTRIDTLFLSAPRGIAGASNAGIGHATGAYVAFMDHDDVLAPHALASVAAEIAAHPDVALIFSDEDQLVHGKPASPYFKPGWNPDLLLSQNLICHLAVFSRAVLADIGGLRAGYEGAQDYDLALRAMEHAGARRVRHVPGVLYHWRQSPDSFSATKAAACRLAARRALQDHLRDGADVVADDRLPQWSRIKFRLPDPLPLVSVILSEQGAMPKTDYPALEIRHGSPGQASGEVIVLLAAGLVALEKDWLHELVAQALRPEIGAAGGKLTGPNGALAHTGYVLDPVHIVQSVLPKSDADDPGYRGHFMLMRTVSAVSGDCMAMRRSVFLQAGGWNGDAGVFADVDFCLRVAARGLRVVWTPHAHLHYARGQAPSTLFKLRQANHKEHEGHKGHKEDFNKLFVSFVFFVNLVTNSHSPQRRGAAWMRARWGDALAKDPYLNPNLTVHRNRLRLARKTRS
jgi:GT2 family glycosyltransferase